MNFRSSRAVGLMALGLFCLGSALAPAQAADRTVEPNQWRVGDSPVPVDTESWGRTYYVRTDGGSARECDGLHDKPLAGAQQRACAWSGPMLALPPEGEARIQGGDRLVIRPGAYMIGLGAPGSENCSTSYPWDCRMQPVPSGPDPKRPTRIVGGLAENGGPSCKGSLPELWGNERVGTILNLKGSNNVRLACLEVTDHSECVEFHPGRIKCERDKFPYGAWASTGLYAKDARNVELINLDIHGMALHGILAGRLTDWRIDNVRLAANGWSGWNGDLGNENSSNSGTMAFHKWLVEWNGCGESYPERKPLGCWSGYGDGVGTAATAGSWNIENSIFRFNTSDGLDLLYHRGDGVIRLNRVWAEGNAGNQIKTLGPLVMTNSVVIATCGHFDKKAYTHQVDNCRALGDAIAVSAAAPKDTLQVIHNTIVSEGNVSVLTGGPAGSTARFANNVIVGLPVFFSKSKNSADLFTDGSPMKLEESANLKQDLRNAQCGAPQVRCAAAGLVDLNRDRVDIALRPDSTARDSGTPPGAVAGSTDYRGQPRLRGKGADRGALEMP